MKPFFETLDALGGAPEEYQQRLSEVVQAVKDRRTKGKLVAISKGGKVTMGSKPKGKKK